MKHCPIRQCLWLALAMLGLSQMAGAAAQVQDPRAPIIVFAAASLTDALQEISTGFSLSSGIEVKSSFAASSALARQIESGAAADVFFSADVDWMDYLQQRAFIQKASRSDILSNRLVLIAPASSTVNVKIAPHFALATALRGGRLATGDPDSVPVGRYARAALTSLGVWSSVQERVVGADNVRAALALVARGEAPLGIVYATDARVEPGVRIVDTFPAGSHPTITYPVAVTSGAREGARQFTDYLHTPPAEAVFVRYGFVPLH